MKEKLFQMASKAGRTVSAAANKTADYVQAHKPTDEDMAQAKAFALKTGKAVASEAVTLSKEVAQSKTFKDAAKGAGVGAVAAIPIPLVGPAIGAVIGAGAGVFLGWGRPSQAPQQALPPYDGAYAQRAPAIEVVAEPPKDLHAELLKLDELRQKGLLTNEEFEVQKQKLLLKV